MRGKQSIRKGIWHIGGKYKRTKKRKRRQKGGAIPFGLLASIGAPSWRNCKTNIRKNFRKRT